MDSITSNDSQNTSRLYFNETSYSSDSYDDLLVGLHRIFPFVSVQGKYFEASSPSLAVARQSDQNCLCLPLPICWQLRVLKPDW